MGKKESPSVLYDGHYIGVALFELEKNKKAQARVVESLGRQFPNSSDMQTMLAQAALSATMPISPNPQPGSEGYPHYAAAA